MSEVQANETTTSKKAPVEVEVVQMTDGREVGVAGKRRLIKEVVESENGAAVRFDFRNGETRQFEVPQSLLYRMAAHGASQKIGDETAGEKDVDDMVLAVDSIIERLSKGEWGAERAAAGSSFAGAGIVVKALVEVTGKSVEEIKAWIDGKIAELNCTRQALYTSLRNPSTAVGKKIAELELEKKSKEAKYDADSLVSELM